MSTPGEATYPQRPRRVRRRALRRERRTRARRRLALLLVVPAAAAAGGLGAYLATSDSEPDTRPLAAPGQVALLAGGERLATITPERAERLAAGRGRLPIEPTRVIERGPVTRTVEVEQALLRERLAAVSADGAAVRVPERAVASRVRTPIVEQAFRNNCETAALSMLLATVGVKQDQRALQDEIAKARPLDPGTRPAGETVWGDPERGFVGRVDGGGPAGGFGVFPGPVAELASRWAEPVNLSGREPGAIYRRLLGGDAVLAWVGLSDGPYETWRSPAGREVTVNFGEHTVVLTGIEGDRLYVNDPLDGQRKVWTKAQFEAMWALLDRRAVSV